MEVLSSRGLLPGGGNARIVCPAKRSPPALLRLTGRAARRAGCLSREAMEAAMAREGNCRSNREDCLHLAVPLPPTFSLQRAVCSYGFFMMAPNCWVDPSPAAISGFLERPLRLVDGRAVQTRIFESNHELKVCIFGVHKLTAEDKDCILAQILRMLRLSETESSAIATFHALHVQAREEGFGRLFRSPTLFEDMIKSLLLCNCGWGRTLAMARALCEFQAELKGLPLGCSDGKPKEVNEVPLPITPEVEEGKRKLGSKKRIHLEVCKSLKFDETSIEGGTSSGIVSLHVESIVRQLESKEETINADANPCESLTSATSLDSTASLYVATGAFPTPEELCAVDGNFLAKQCSLGYRGMHIWKLAKDICDGVVDLQSLENREAERSLQLEDARSKLLRLPGFGPFTSANVLMCMGEYSIIPTDSETVRHLRQVHHKSSCTLASVSKIAAAVYASFAPYQFLSYWFELWGSYEKRFGKLSCMDPSNYGLITGVNMRKKAKK